MEISIQQYHPSHLLPLPPDSQHPTTPSPSQHPPSSSTSTSTSPASSHSPPTSSNPRLASSLSLSILTPFIHLINSSCISTALSRRSKSSSICFSWRTRCAISCAMLRADDAFSRICKISWLSRRVLGRMLGVGMKRRGRVRGHRAEVGWVGGIVGGWGVTWCYRRESAKVGGDVVVWCWIFLDVGVG